MTLRTLIVRSLRFHWRAHLGVVLGAAVGSAALIGALVVGDSVRGSLREMAVRRLGPIEYALQPGDRLFWQDLPFRIDQAISHGAYRAAWYKLAGINSSWGKGTAGGAIFRKAQASVFLRIPATVSRADGGARANHVKLYGTDGIGPWFTSLYGAGVNMLSPFDRSGIVLNQALAAQLQAQPGDMLVVRLRKPEALSADSPISPQDNSTVVMRLTVDAVLDGQKWGDLNLTASQLPPLNAFVALNRLQQLTGANGQANLMVVSALQERGFATPRWQELVRRLPAFLRNRVPRFFRGDWYEKSLPASDTQQILASALEFGLYPADLQLQIHALPAAQRAVELRSSRIFLDPPLVAALLSLRSNTTAQVNPVVRGSAGSLPAQTAETAALPRADEPSALPAGFPRAGGLRPDRRPTQPPYGVLTYLVNLMRAGEQTTPYSMVTAAAPPLVPSDLRDDEIIITQWLAEDLKIGPGGELELSYYLPDQAARLVEQTNRFRVRAVWPMDHPAVDRTLMPEFPGLAKAEKTGDWDTSFPLMHQIRPKDDAYWRQYRGTPKAFLTLAAGQRLWGNRFGNLTALRFPVASDADTNAPLSLVKQVEELVRAALLEPNRAALAQQGGTASAPPPLLDQLGFRFEPVRELALRAANQAQDFGQLFLGFSIFLIAAALVLMALLFQFGVEQRRAEVGTLLALGFQPKTVRRLFLREGVGLALVGGAVGVALGVSYARAMLRGLATVWRDAVGGTTLNLHVSAGTLLIGGVAAVLVAAFTIWLTLRQLGRQPARELLTGEAGSAALGARSRGWWIGGASFAGALALLGWALTTGQTSHAGAFFGAGALVLMGGLGCLAGLLDRWTRAHSRANLGLGGLGFRGCVRRRNRSLAVAGLLASGSFIIAAIGAFQLDANRAAWDRRSGTGGFALLGESTLPIVQDLNTRSGRESFGLDEQALTNVSFVPLRVRDGDDASCLNLNRAQRPRLLGVRPDWLAERGAFTFAQVARGSAKTAQPWTLLTSEASSPTASAASPAEIPAIGDQNSIRWALGKRVGDTLDLTDARGQPFKVRIVAAVANSILQGSLLISEAEFAKRFPNESGYRMFLVDAPSNRVAEVSATLSRALQDVGLELTPAPRRLAQFNAVQNTYLNTFQVLGGLGLLLGSAGLGVVLLRNVLERRGEVALLQAVGFRRRTLQWLVLSEHAGLLGVGLGVGCLAALVAILPVLLTPGGQARVGPLLMTLVAVGASGCVWTWLATKLAFRGELLQALRNE
jgi:ABC-type antimicrobial peptide transport system permease subunit